jgi:hypothetical protein
MKHPKIGPSAGNARSVPGYDDALQGYMVGATDWPERRVQSPGGEPYFCCSASQVQQAAHIDTQLQGIAAAQVAGHVVPAHVPSPDEIVHALFTQSMPDGQPEKPERDLNTTRKDSGTTRRDSW